MVKTIFSAGSVQTAIVNEVKAPLTEGLNSLHDGVGRLQAIRKLWQAYQAYKKIPEPTKANVHHPNTMCLIDIRDEFFSLENNPGRLKAFRAIWNFLIVIYDYDSYYRHRIDWAIEKVVKLVNMGLWQSRPANRPRRDFWREFDGSQRSLSTLLLRRGD